MAIPKTFEEAIPMLDTLTSAFALNRSQPCVAPDWQMVRTPDGFLVYSFVFRDVFGNDEEARRRHSPTPLAAAVDFIASIRKHIEKRIASGAASVTSILEESAALSRLLKE
jgi:hypothetical protein